MACKACEAAKGLVNKVIQITEAFIEVTSPSPENLETAKQRMAICSACENIQVCNEGEKIAILSSMQMGAIPKSVQEIGMTNFCKCTACSCYLVAKQFATGSETCPMNKWN